jgi:hypothetical protein
MRRGLSSYLHRRKSKLKRPRTNLKVRPEVSFIKCTFIIGAKVFLPIVVPKKKKMNFIPFRS